VQVQAADAVKILVRPERLELPTLCSEGRCSIQLSYGRPEFILRQSLGRWICTWCFSDGCTATVVLRKVKGAASWRVWAPSCLKLRSSSLRRLRCFPRGHSHPTGRCCPTPRRSPTERAGLKCLPRASRIPTFTKDTRMGRPQKWWHSFSCAPPGLVLVLLSSQFWAVGCILPPLCGLLHFKT
jgi:hypothetical protein